MSRDFSIFSAVSLLDSVLTNALNFISLKPHHFPYHTVCHFDRTDKDEHIEHQFPDITPHHRDRRRIGVDCGRGRRKHREDDAGKHNDCPLKAHGGVALDEALSHALARLSRKRGQRHGGDCGIKIQFKKPAVHRHYHNERQHRNEQPAYQRDRP